MIEVGEEEEEKREKVGKVPFRPNLSFGLI